MHPTLHTECSATPSPDSFCHVMYIIVFCPNKRQSFEHLMYDLGHANKDVSLLLFSSSLVVVF